MKDILILILLFVVLSVTMIVAGMQFERAYINHILPRVLTAEFMRGAKMGAEFQKNQDERDQLQPVQHNPAKIGDSDESLAH